MSKIRKSKIIAGLIAVSFVLSFAAGYIPLLCTLAEGTRTVILTVIISAAAALLFPKVEVAENE